MLSQSEKNPLISIDRRIFMNTLQKGDQVEWSGYRTMILGFHDRDFVYIAIGNDGAQLVHVSELVLA